MPGLKVAGNSTSSIPSTRAPSHACLIMRGPEKQVQDRGEGLGKSWSVSTLQAQIQSFPFQSLRLLVHGICCVFNMCIKKNQLCEFRGQRESKNKLNTFVDAVKEISALGRTSWEASSLRLSQ